MIYLSLIVLGGMLTVSASAAAASPRMTCATFGQMLADAILAGGSKISFPNNFAIGFYEAGNPFIRYSFSGNSGLRGSLNCLRNDEFRNIYIEAPLDSESEAENSQRIERAKALGSAALCVTEHWRAESCDKAISTLVQKSRTAFLAAKRYGKSISHGDEYEIFPSGAKVDVSTAEGSFVIIVHSSRPRE
jgi:hypothetical protein